MIQPHLPVRLPCYDFTPIANSTLDNYLPKVSTLSLGVSDSRGVTGGVYKARERIQRNVADLRLLAIPTSCSRVADYNSNWDRLLGFAPPRGLAAFCTGHCSTCVAPDIRAMLT